MQRVGRYEITGELGRGGFGVVYQGRDPALDRPVAVKVLSPAAAADPDLVERFRREGRAAAALAHRNVVTVYECGDDGGLPYIAMEFLGTGSSLQRLLETGRLPALPLRCALLRQAAEGLHFAHQHGFVHRDVKPANLWLLEDGTLKILDFGIARSASSDLTRSGQILGTVAYMSPEQLRGQRVDPRSDVFSLGLVAWELLAGKRAFRGSPSEVVANILGRPAPPLVSEGVPDWLAAAVHRCLEKDPARRFQTAEDFARVLRDAPPFSSGTLPAQDELATATSDGSAGRGVAAAPAAGPARAETRFTPGTLLAGRYRIVASLGRGGMGEVYRADDTRLGHTVALKFLPPGVAAEPARLDRLFQEVRVAREVSHPNVCRVYDVGEADGVHFLTMEYVDGEDLASLLRRIGRLSTVKALEIARELSAGLAAAHDKGVVHRDLKPANVMLDGRGSVRVTDFGLAVLGEVSGAEAAAGTPAYMAPEQLAGGEVSARSDVYALGLVLYELMTGRRRFQATTLPEVMAQHAEGRPLLLDGAGDTPPEMAQAVLQCLQEDPASRPPTARAVLETLPGGDPLQAVVRAGLTPSPAQVAAAGRSGVLRPAFAMAAFGFVVLATAFCVLTAGRTTRLGLLAPPKATGELASRARSLLAELGFGEPAERVAFHRTGLPTSARWPDDIDFVYREAAAPSPVPDDPRDGTITPLGYSLRVSADNPPAAPGLRDVFLDTQGRLIEYRAPAASGGSGSAGAEPDWAALFARAALDQAQFRPVAPAIPAPVPAEREFAWESLSRDEKGRPVRVEGASVAGRPVWFRVPQRVLRFSWRRRWTPEASREVGLLLPSFTLLPLMLLAPAAAWLGRRNLRGGRGDVRGALALGSFAFVVGGLARLATAHYHTEPQTPALLAWLDTIIVSFPMIWRAVASALLEAAALAVTYLAVEPLLRRSWPETLIGWNRLLAGQRGDPMVGRDVLLGVAAALVATLAQIAFILLTQRLDVWGVDRFDLDLLALDGPRELFGAAAGATFGAVAACAAYFLLLTALALVLRRRPVALGLLFVILIGAEFSGTAAPALALLSEAVLALLLIAVMTRLGLLATFAFCLVRLWVLQLLLPTDASAGTFSLVIPALLVLLAGWGFRTSLGSNRLLTDDLPGE
jgi:serine/threonine protein kinase